MFSKRDRAQRRKFRVRRIVRGDAGRPRLSVHATLQHLYGQMIDDAGGVTLAAASTVSPEIASKLKATGNVDAARLVGRLLGEKAKARGLTQAVFDRGSRLYHGRVRAFAQGVREGGVQF